MLLKSKVSRDEPAPVNNNDIQHTWCRITLFKESENMLCFVNEGAQYTSHIFLSFSHLQVEQNRAPVDP